MTNTIQRDLYSDIIRKIRCGSYHGKTIKAKPILLYSIINMIESGIVVNNRIPFDPCTENAYKETFVLFGLSTTPFFKPYFYLQFDELWHLEWNSGKIETDKISAKLIRENVKYAYLDNALWDLLQEQEMRDYFRELIETHYLQNNSK